MATFVDIPGDKRKFVAGMYWRHEDRVPNRRSLLEGARGEDFWVVTRKTRARSMQSGFCPPIQDRLTGKVYSLAAAIAEVMEEPWLGIFDLGNGLYWYIAVRDNYEVLPDGDLVGDYDAVERARRSHAAYGEWTNFVDGDLNRLAEILHNSKNSNRITDLRKKPWVPVAWSAGGLSLVLAGAAVGLHFYMAHEHRVKEEKMAAMMRQVAIERAMAAKKAAASVPWRTNALPSSFVGACLQAAQSVPFSESGWILDKIQCQQQPGGHWEAFADWQIGPGATALARPAGQLAKRGTQVLHSPVNSGVLSRLPSQSGVIPMDAAENRLYGVSQLTGVPVQLEHAGTPEAISHPGANNKPATVADSLWKGLPIQMQAFLPVFQESLPLLDTVPGLRLESVKIVEPVGESADKGIMVTVEGKLYVQS